MIVNQLVSLDSKNWNRKKGTNQWSCYHSPIMSETWVSEMKLCQKQGSEMKQAWE